MRRLFLAALCVCAFIPSAPASAQQMETLFEEGNAAFYEGEYETAIERFESLREAGVVDPDLSYNLGTAYAKAGRYGDALLNFERSLYLDAGASDARTNLEATQRGLAERLTATRGEIETGESRGLGEAIVRDIDEITLAVVFLVCWGFVFILLMIRLYASTPRRRVATGAGAALFFVFAVTFAILLASKNGFFQEGDPAVVTRVVDLLEGPDPRATSRGEAFEGERGSVVDSDGDYVRIALGGGRGGWLLRENVGLVVQ